MSPGEAKKQDGEHDEGNDYVHPVALQRKGYDGERHPDNGSGDQEQQSELNDVAAVKRRAPAENPCDRAVLGRFAYESRIVGYFAAVAVKEEKAPQGDYR